MPVTVTPYGNDPILMVEFTGTTNAATLQEMYALSDEQLQFIDAPVAWRLIDITTADITFADVIHAFKTLDPDQPGSMHDQRFHTFFSSPHPMARLISDMLAQKQFGGVSVPVFPGLGEALLYVQDEVYRLRAGAGY